MLMRAVLLLSSLLVSEEECSEIPSPARQVFTDDEFVSLWLVPGGRWSKH